MGVNFPNVFSAEGNVNGKIVGSMAQSGQKFLGASVEGLKINPVQKLINKILPSNPGTQIESERKNPEDNISLPAEKNRTVDTTE